MSSTAVINAVSLIPCTLRDPLPTHPESPEIETMMVPLRDRLSWMIGLYARRSELVTSTWLEYRTRARPDLLHLAEQPWTDPDCVRMAKRIRREVDLWVTFLWDDTGEMEPTDNRSERALRPAVIDRDRMQQNRSLRGVYRDEILRSVANTCQQLDVSFETVAVEALLARTKDGPTETLHRNAAANAGSRVSSRPCSVRPRREADPSRSSELNGYSRVSVHSAPASPGCGAVDRMVRKKPSISKD